MKKAYKDKYFGESTIFRWYGDSRKRHLSDELAQRRQEIVMNDRNFNTGVNTILQRKSANDM